MARGTLTGRAGTGLPAVRTPGFVGRADELTALTTALAHPPCVAFVTGEPGIGKSRLVREALRRRGGDAALVAVCPPFREPLTLGAIIDAIRDAVDTVAGLPLSGLAGALRPVFPEWVCDLPPAPESAEDPSAARHRLFRALVELLEVIDVRVLVVEDVHWADEATLELLLFLATRGLGSTSLVVTYRPEDVQADSLLWRLSSRLPHGVSPLRLELGPLDVTETGRLVSSMLADEQVSAEFAAFLHERTDGVPLAVEESVRVLHDNADLVPRRGGWVRRHLDDIAVPPSIRDAVLERAARLSPDGQAVLRAAAVLAAPSPERLLLDVAGGLAPEAITEAVASGLLDEDVRGLVAFRHELSARAVHDAIPAPSLHAMHRAAGEALERMPAPPVARLARHFKEAGATDRWYHYAEQAAGLATLAGDEATAAAVLHELITDARQRASEVVRLCRKLSYSSYTDARRHELAGTLRGWLTGGRVTGAEAATIRFQLGRLLFVMGDYEAGRTELEAAYQDLPQRSVEAVRTMMYLGTPLGDPRPAGSHLAWLRRAADLLPSVGRADQVRIRSGLLTALLMLGEESGWYEGEKIPDDAAAATPGERVDIAVAHANMGEVAMHWGRYAEAQAYLDRAAEMADHYDFQRLGENVAATSLRLRLRTGDWRVLTDEATALANNPDVVPRTHNEAVLVGAVMHSAAGDLESAARSLADVRDVAARWGDLDHLTESVAVLGRVLLYDGRVDDALDMTEQATSTVVGNQMWLWLTELLPVRVDALVRSGRVADAAELVRTCGRGLEGFAPRTPRIALTRSRATVAEARGEHERAGALYLRAARAWSALPRPLEALLARERHAMCVLASGRTDDGVALLAEVFRELSGLGASVPAERIAAVLRHHGVDARRDWRRGRRGYGDQLSPREAEVVRLVATGRTNREIAAVLARSPKTVAGQLNSAMRKLGVSTRTALAVRAVESGLVAEDG